MIARDSKSYPYLAIAQHYNIPYATVLAYSGKVASWANKDFYVVPPYSSWKLAVWKLEHDK